MERREESGWGRSETMYDGLRFLYRVFLRPLHSELSTSAPPRVDVCAQSGSGKRSRSVSKLALFFSPPVPIDIHEPVRPAAKCGTSTRDGLIERCVWSTFSILFHGGVLVSRIFIAYRAIRVSFLSRVLNLYDTQAILEYTYFSTFSSSPSVYHGR